MAMMSARNLFLTATLIATRALADDQPSLADRAAAALNEVSQVAKKGTGTPTSTPKASNPELARKTDDAFKEAEAMAQDTGAQTSTPKPSNPEIARKAEAASQEAAKMAQDSTVNAQPSKAPVRKLHAPKR